MTLFQHYLISILNIVADCAFNKEKPVAKRADGRDFMTEKRKVTFKKKYEEYKKIYYQNKNSENFANWVFEDKLLGYNPTVKLKTVFEEPQSNFTDCLELDSIFSGDSVKIVGVIEDVYKGKTRKNNSTFYKFQLKDEVGRTSALLLDGRKKNLTKYIEQGLKIPEKDDIVVFTGRKGDDTVWLENIGILNDKIYMKLSDIE